MFVDKMFHGQIVGWLDLMTIILGMFTISAVFSYVFTCFLHQECLVNSGFTSAPVYREGNIAKSDKLLPKGTSLQLDRKGCIEPNLSSPKGMFLNYQ